MPDERGVASAIYGLVICSATLASSAVSGRLSIVAVSVLVTVAVYWVAESYAHALARHAVTQTPLGWSGIRAILSPEEPAARLMGPIAPEPARDPLSLSGST